MIESVILATTLGVVGWAVWPPRGDQGRWLLLGLLGLWAALVAVGWRRGIAPGFVPWLLLLSLLGALVGLIVVWSLANLLGRGRGDER